MLIRWFLFETKLGELLLILLERSTGLAFVQVDWLGAHCCGEPKSADKAQNDSQGCLPEDQEVADG
jgi:hypothetical protein